MHAENKKNILDNMTITIDFILLHDATHSICMLVLQVKEFYCFSLVAMLYIV